MCFLPTIDDLLCPLKSDFIFLRGCLMYKYSGGEGGCGLGLLFLPLKLEGGYNLGEHLHRDISWAKVACRKYWVLD